MAAEEIPVTQARSEFAELVNRVGYGGERIAVTRHGRRLAALVSAEDLDRLEELDALAQEPVRAVSSITRAGSPERPARRQFGIAARYEPPEG